MQGRKKVPFPHDQTLSHYHTGQDEHQEDFCHLVVHQGMAAFSSPHNALYHKRSNQPIHLIKESVY